MSELRLHVETDSDLGTHEMAQRFLSVLSCHARFMPDRFGIDEPLRARYDRSANDSFVQLWLGKAIEPGWWSGTVLLSRKSGVRYYGRVSWVRGQRRMNSVDITVVTKGLSPKVANELVSVGRELFVALRGQYGSVCDREEYVTKNMTGWWADPQSGRPVGGEHHGYDRTRYLPGVYWANMFGPAYIGFFGGDRLATAPVFDRRRLDSAGWLLLTAKDPWCWKDSVVRQAQTALMEHLGRDAFFDLLSPDRQTRAPHFNLTATISGRRRSSPEPIAREYLRSRDESLWFVEHVLELVGKLRTRFKDRATLDLSPSSLAGLDRAARHLSSGAKEQPREIILEVAAYYGEVVRRDFAGQWSLSGGGVPAVAIPEVGTPEDPVVRAIKFVLDGEPLAPWYDLIKRGGERVLQ